MGSGKWLKRSIKKYGIENFQKEILFVFETKEEAYSKEKELVTEEVLNSGKCYNLKLGGFGGWDLARIYFLNKFPDGVQHGRIQSKETKDKISKSRTGLTATEETKIKMSVALKGKYAGENSRCFGLKWITDGNQEKQINKSDDLPKDWRYGRLPFTQKAKKNMAISRLGNTNGRKQKVKSDESK